MLVGSWSHICNFQTIFVKCIFFVVCYHWSFCSFISVVSQWSDKDFLKCLAHKGKWCLFKCHVNHFSPWGLKQWPGSVLVPYQSIVVIINTQSWYLEDKVLIAHSGSRKLYQPRVWATVSLLSCLLWGWEVGDGSHHTKG